MFFYEPKAITFKNINKFSYEIYTDIGINMLKYNNDSSTVFRILDALTSATRETLDDLPYSALFTATNISYRQIDRLHKFYLENIPGASLDINEDNIVCNSIFTGYSKYTDKTYTMEFVPDKNDFVRHSYPCDCFITKKLKVGTPAYLTLEPNLWKDANIYVNHSAITIRPIGPMDPTTKDAAQEFITVVVEGINTRNELVQENVNINYWCEHKTDTEFIFINKLKVINSFVSYDIILYPYIDGKEDAWFHVVTDREEFDRRNAIVKFNTSTRKIEYSQIYHESIEFPVPTDLVKTVGITGIEDDEQIYDYYIDQPNGLFYVITSANKLYCYPFIIPKAISNLVDLDKTLYQACKIEYIEDAQNEKYIFDVFPTSKANGVDSLDIIINGQLYKDGMIIDLFREKLIDNRIEIPFSDMFKYTDASLIEFRVFGSQDSLYPILLVKPQVDPLYVKDFGFNTYNNNFGDIGFIIPNDKSTSIDYQNSGLGAITLNASSKIYKLSKCGNIIVDGYLITDIFKTFYYSYSDNSIITHDGITHVKADRKQGITISKDHAETGVAETGIAETGGGLYDTYRYIR